MTKEHLRIFDATASFYNVGVKGLTLGLYSRFLRQAVGHMDLQLGEKVLDVCTGTGINLDNIASQIGQSGEAVGVDLSRGMLRVAEKELGARTNVRLMHGDITELEGYEGHFDKALMSFCLHEIGPGRRARALRHVWNMLKDRGLLVIADYNNVPYKEHGFVARMGLRMLEDEEGRTYLDIDLRALLTEQGFTRLHQVPFFSEKLLITKAFKAAE